jgi:spermatogenesis-associated protein 6
MPLRAFKCEVDLTIHAISAPGVRLSSKEDLYLNVCFLGQQRRTRLVAPVFPLIFDDRLNFNKVILIFLFKKRFNQIT